MTGPDAMTDSQIQRKLSDLEKEQMALLAEQDAKLAAAHARLEGAGYGAKSRGGASRILEDVAFALGLVLIVGRATIEGGQDIGLWPTPNGHSPSSILLEFLRSSLLIVPKMLGRATGGAVWGAIGSATAKLIGRGGKPSDDKDMP